MPSLMDLLSYAGNFLDLPASSLRDIFSGNNPLDQYATPFSDENRATGRDVLAPLIGANEETGMSGWLDNPMEGVKDIAGFGLESLLDPANLFGSRSLLKLLKAREAAQAGNAAELAARGGKYGYVNPKVLAEQIPDASAPQKLIGYSGPPLKTLQYEDLAKYDPRYQTNTWADKNAVDVFQHGDEIPHPNTYLVKSTHYPSADSMYRSMNPGSHVGDGVTMPVFGAYSGLNPGHAAYRAAAANMGDTLGQVDVLRRMDPSTAQGLDVFRIDNGGRDIRYPVKRSMNNMWNEASDMFAAPRGLPMPRTGIWDEGYIDPIAEAGHAGPFIRPDNLVSTMSNPMQPVPNAVPKAAMLAIYNMLQAFNRSGGLQ